MPAKVRRRVPYGQKKCCRCGHPKPKTTEFFCRDSSMKDGLCSRCKVCERKRQKAVRETPSHKAYLAASMRTEAYKAVRRAQQKLHGTEWKRIYTNTPVGKAVNQRTTLRARLKKCQDPARRVDLHARIDELGQMIERLRTKRAKDALFSEVSDRAVADKTRNYLPPTAKFHKPGVL